MTEGDDQNLRERLKIESPALEEINHFLLGPDNPAINAVLRIMAGKGKKGGRRPKRFVAEAMEHKQLDWGGRHWGDLKIISYARSDKK